MTVQEVIDALALFGDENEVTIGAPQNTALNDRLYRSNVDKCYDEERGGINVVVLAIDT